MTPQVIKLLVLISSFAVALIGAYDQDQINHLPGTYGPPLGFRQYAGYLDASLTDQNNKSKADSYLYYWLVESQATPQSDPLLVWFNGGPGCSSLVGLFNELGPFQLAHDPRQSNGTIVELRTFPWNLHANVLFIDSPLYAGFSYTTQGDWLTQSDDSVAQLNLRALKSFFGKFPRLKQNKLYLAGEGYAGAYVALLGQLLDPDAQFNFKGVAFGSPQLDEAKSYQSVLLMAHHYGLYGKSYWDAYGRACCSSEPPSRESCQSFSVQSNPCGDISLQIVRLLDASGVNLYNVLQDCPHNTAGGLTNVPRCVDDTLLINYLNDPQVRRALHVSERLDNSKWSPCVPLFYEGQYYKQPGGLTKQVSSLIDSHRNLTILLYAGDVDLTGTNFMGTEWFADDLGREVIREVIPWHVAGQVAGQVKHFRGLSYLTIKGAGHWAARDRPREALAMIEKFMYPKGRNVSIIGRQMALDSAAYLQ